MIAGDVESLCSQIIVIDKGQAVYDGPIEQFHRKVGGSRRLSVQLDRVDSMVTIHTKLADAGIRCERPCIERGDGWVELEFNEDRVALVDILKVLMSTYPVLDVKTGRMDLEDLIRNLYGKKGQW